MAPHFPNRPNNVRILSLDREVFLRQGLCGTGILYRLQTSAMCSTKVRVDELYKGENGERATTSSGLPSSAKIGLRHQPTPTDRHPL